MTGRVRLVAALLAALCLLPGAYAAGDPAGHPLPSAVEPAAAEIEWLIHHVADSGLVFVRNGRKHEAAEAARHMERKYRHFEDEIETTREFIEKAATRSLLTGRPYEVVLPDGRHRATAEWLLEALAGHRAALAATRKDAA